MKTKNLTSHPLPEQVALATACRELFDGPLLSRAMSATDWKYRERILTAEVMLGAIVHLVVSPCRSLLELMDRLRRGELGGQPPLEFSSTAFYNRLRGIPHDFFLEVLREVTKSLHERGGPVRQNILRLAPFANRILAVDDTTLDALMRQTKSAVEQSKATTEQLAGRLGCVIDLATQRFAEVMYDSDAASNEKTHFWPVVERLGAGNLVVFDLGYFSFELFDRLTDNFTWYISRMRSKTSYEEVSVGISTPRYRESLIRLGKHRADRAKYTVRLVELKVGDTWHRYITNMLDPQQLRADAIWKLYQERWTIEKAFAVLKRALGGAYLHTTHTNGTLTQIWATLAVYQVLQDLRLDAATAQKVDVETISWLNLIRRVGWYLERPREDQTLRQWLTSPKDDLLLQKRGVRERKPDHLPDAMIRSIRGFKPSWDPGPNRIPRTGKPEPRTKESTTIVAKMAP